MASHMNSIEALRRMVAEQVSREGATSSFMVRAGLLLEILDTRVAETELREALKKTLSYLEYRHSITDYCGDTEAAEEASGIIRDGNAALSNTGGGG